MRLIYTDLVIHKPIISPNYKRIALLVHPDKHPSEETDTWAAKMKRLNALREALE